MKARGVAVLCLLATMSLPAWAQTEKPAAGPSDQEMEAMMKGVELTRSGSDKAPDAPPAESTGTMHAEMILGGRYVQSAWKGNMMGQPFEGHGTDGYDNLSKQHVSSWVDNMGTGILYMTGTCDGAGKVCTSSGDMIDPMTNKKGSMKSVTTWADNDNFKFELFGRDGNGDEVKMMEMTLKRKS